MENNEIYKYRAYVKKTKEVLIVASISWHTEQIQCFRHETIPCFDFNEIILLPFTTLTLPNGQEVFAGDLIAIHNDDMDGDDGIWQVVWQNDWLQWNAKHVFATDDLWLCEFIDEKDAYIAGNANTPEGKEIIETGKWSGRWDLDV